MKRYLERGVTLVELMIAIAIGLLVIVTILAVYLSGTNVQRAQSDTVDFNENARFAFDLIEHEFMKAGFRNTWETGSTGHNFCATGATGSAFLGRNDPTTINPTTADFSGGTQVAVLNKSDVLRVRFYGESTGATAPVNDCQGYPVTAGHLIEDTLYVAADANNNDEPTLFCNTQDLTAATAHDGTLPMVAGVESLQLLYGQDTDADGSINSYLPWDNTVTSATAGAAAVDNILSIKISAVIRSANAVTTDTRTANLPMYHFGSSYPSAANADGGAVFQAPADRRIRKIFSAESAFRNFPYCSSGT
jgi:type IV pilus assembly protein PilW